MKKMKLLSIGIALIAATTLVNGQSTKSSTKKSETLYVETGKMKLKEGVTDEQFIAIEKNIRKGIINKQSGFISREFGKDADGFWHFRICWTSKEAGDAWTPIFQKNSNGQAMMNALDFSTVRQEHYTVVNP